MAKSDYQTHFQSFLKKLDRVCLCVNLFSAAKTEFFISDEIQLK